MTRPRERVAITVAIGSWLSVFVALWALSGCLAILVYRAEQIGAHRCLRGLPLPTGYLQVGLIALVAAAALAGVALWTRVENRGPRLRRAAIAGIAIFVPLVSATLVLYLSAPSTETMGEDACTGSSIDYIEGLT
jgi:hypothetical protein